MLNKCRAITDSQERGVHVSLPLISADQGQGTPGGSGHEPLKKTDESGACLKHQSSLLTEC